MIGFGFLLSLTLGVCGAALLRGRPTTLVLAGNNAVVLRALQNIDEYGQPESQSFLPSFVFAPENIRIAAHVMTIVTILLMASVAIGRGRVLRADPRQLAALPRWLIASLAIYIIAYILQSKTIWQAAYADPSRSLFGLNVSGAHLLLVGLILYEINRRVATGRLRAGYGVALICLMCTMTDFVKGATGIGIGIVAAGTMFIWYGAAKLSVPWLRVTVVLLALIVVGVTIRTLRHTLHESSNDQVAGLWEGLMDDERQRQRSAEGIESRGNGSQYAAHLLECITLYEKGISREWRSIYNVVEYTLKPSFIAGPLGVTRSKEAPWELGDYFVGGGGIYVWGELYWNGGYLCVLLVGAALVLWCFMIDRRFASGTNWLLLACNFAPSLMQGTGYGFNQVCRGAINGLIAIGVLWGVRQISARSKSVAPRLSRVTIPEHGVVPWREVATSPAATGSSFEPGRGQEEKR